MAIIEHSYRNEWEWDDELMPRNHARLVTWKGSVGGAASDVLDQVRACLDNDLDTPGAVAVIDSAAALGHDVSTAASLLGVELAEAIGPR
jgi:L-cysteine:1D-myo-inositol 2-amino-2-deoxy-alpha-D-glucopyranoside ligase